MKIDANSTDWTSQMISCAEDIRNAKSSPTGNVLISFLNGILIQKVSFNDIDI